MSKSLRKTVETEIERREILRIQKEQKEEEAKRKISKGEIIRIFEMKLANCLEELEDYTGHSILEFTTRSIFEFESVAKELGFVLSQRNENECYYDLNIPELQEGCTRTHAQILLQKFQKTLEQKRRERKWELLKEFNRVKRVLREGKEGTEGYDYKFENKVLKIVVLSEEKINTKYEKNVVKQCFLKVGFKLEEISKDNEWIFSL